MALGQNIFILLLGETTEGGHNKSNIYTMQSNLILQQIHSLVMCIIYLVHVEEVMS